MDWLFKLSADISNASSQSAVDMNSYIRTEVAKATVCVGIIYLIIFFMTVFYLFGGKRWGKNKRK